MQLGSRGAVGVYGRRQDLVVTSVIAELQTWWSEICADLHICKGKGKGEGEGGRGLTH